MGHFTANRTLLLLLIGTVGFSTHISSATPVGERWVGTWAASPEAQLNTTPMSTDATFREIVHVSTGGAAVRVVVTNEFGLEPLNIGAAGVAISTGDSSIDASAAKILSFGGQASVTLPAGTLAVSDPISMEVPALANLAVSLFVPAQLMSQSTVHSYALQTSYIATGNVTSAKTLTDPVEISSWNFLKGIEVVTARYGASGAAIVALGDSITDGAASARNANGRWPDVLARRIHADKALSGMGVLNAGINGNRLLHEGYGESALRRLDRDVLSQAGVRYLLVLEGINDIGHIITASPSDPAETAASLIRALQQIALRAHTHGIRVIGATITPYESCKYASPDGEKIREAVNDWIRTSKDLDGVADFEKIVRDPAHPTRFLPAFDSGDHLHPNAAGLRAMGNGIDLNLLKD